MKHLKNALIVYCIIAVLNLLGNYFGWEIITATSKVLLMLTLLLLVLLAPKFTYRTLVILAISFSWFGDTFLLFQEHDSLFFLLGLGSFLLAHVFYILFFARSLSQKHSSGSFPKIIIFVMLVYLVGFLKFIWPYLEEMTIPVLIYAIMIGIMVVLGFKYSRDLAKNYDNLLFVGAFLFAVSDTILAVNKFALPIANAGVLIMFTYIFAQGAIVWSILNGREELK